MPLSGKYDFPGIKKWGAKGLSAALASTPWGSWLVTTWGLKDVVDIALAWLANWLANKGLVVLNLGAIYVEGEFDQAGFDREMDAAIKKVEDAKGKLTPEQIKAIDDEIIKVARKFIVITKHN